LATQQQYEWLRTDVGLAPDDIVTLPDAQAEDNFTRAAVVYPDPANPLGAQDAYTRVITIEQLYAQAVTSTDYRQNNSQESASQLFDHYKLLLDLWNGKLSNAVSGVAAGGGSAMFGLVDPLYPRGGRW
jgi:hypothetical protein